MHQKSMSNNIVILVIAKRGDKKIWILRLWSIVHGGISWWLSNFGVTRRNARSQNPQRKILRAELVRIFLCEGAYTIRYLVPSGQMVRLYAIYIAKILRHSHVQTYQLYPVLYPSTRRPDVLIPTWFYTKPYPSILMPISLAPWYYYVKLPFWMQSMQSIALISNNNIMID